jgi:hypothetical protein
MPGKRGVQLTVRAAAARELKRDGRAVREDEAIVIPARARACVVAVHLGSAEGCGYPLSSDWLIGADIESSRLVHARYPSVDDPRKKNRRTSMGRGATCESGLSSYPCAFAGLGEKRFWGAALL